jgi:hypothetical protein
VVVVADHVLLVDTVEKIDQKTDNQDADLMECA